MNRRVLMILLTATALGCGGGGGSDTPTSPTTPTTPTNPNTPPVATTTITITAAGVSPSRITVAPGSRVTFINNDSRAHEMNSDPHPNHGDCPAIDTIGFIQVGQTKVTSNLTDIRTCGFHDHNLPENDSLKGQIIVQ